MSYDANKLTYDGFELFGREVLFTGARVDRDTLPKGIYAYDLRHGDDNGIPCTLEKSVVVNHFGTVLCNRPFSLPKEGYRLIGEDDYSFSGLPECTLADYMKTHPPKHKEPQR